jgi:hypothetical protein
MYGQFFDSRYRKLPGNYSRQPDPAATTLPPDTDNEPEISRWETLALLLAYPGWLGCEAQLANILELKEAYRRRRRSK